MKTLLHKEFVVNSITVNFNLNAFKGSKHFKYSMTLKMRPASFHMYPQTNEYLIISLLKPGDGITPNCWVGEVR